MCDATSRFLPEEQWVNCTHRKAKTHRFCRRASHAAPPGHRNQNQISPTEPPPHYPYPNWNSQGETLQISTCVSVRPLVRSTPNASSTCEKVKAARSVRSGGGGGARGLDEHERGVRVGRRSLPRRRTWRRRPPWAPGGAAASGDAGEWEL